MSIAMETEEDKAQAQRDIGELFNRKSGIESDRVKDRKVSEQ